MNTNTSGAIERQALVRLKAGDAAGAEADLIAALGTAMAESRPRLMEALGEAQFAQGCALEGACTLEQAGNEPRVILRRARMLIVAGKFPNALAALEGLPASTRQGFEFWSLKADALRHMGQWSRAVEAASKALKANPTSRNMALIRAAGLGHAGDWAQADPIFARYTDFPPALEMYAGALVGSGRIDTARAMLSAALKRFPLDSGLHRAFAMIAWMAGERETFANTLIAAAEAHPDNLALGMVTADLLRRADRFEEALARLEGLRRKYPSPQIASACAIVLSELGRYPEAADLARSSAAQANRVDWIRRNAATILLSAGAVDEALVHSAWGLGLDPQDQEWIAIDAVAQRAAGDLSYRNTYDFDRFVKAFDLSPPDGFQTIDAFISALAVRLRELHNFSSHPLDQSLRGGSQLQLNPNTPQDPLLEKLFQALKTPIDQYLSALAKDANHPFLSRNKGKWRMQGCWSVRLLKGGSHVNHIHPEGWISSAFYVVVPPSVRAESNVQQGWITFGAPAFRVQGLLPEHSVCPRPGKLVLFPSYMWHGVNAFDEDAERISVAFDLVPD